MLRSEKVSTPFTAATLVVPESVAPVEFVPRATAIVPVKLGTGFPLASRAATCSAGEIVPLTRALLGWTVNASRVAGGAAGLRASAMARPVLGELKVQIHCGTSEAQLASTAHAAT